MSSKLLYPDCGANYKKEEKNECHAPMIGCVSHGPKHPKKPHFLPNNNSTLAPKC